MQFSSQLQPYILMLAGILVSFLAFMIGRRMGGSSGNTHLPEDNNLLIDQHLMEERNLRRSLQTQIDQLNQQNQRYLQMFITLPDTVKQLSSNLTMEEVTSSMVRLAYNLTHAGQICLFLYNSNEKRLFLSLAHGLKKQQINHLSYKLGDGRIGITGESKIVLSEEDFKHNPEYVKKIGRSPEPFDIDFSAPIRFKDTLHGVLCVGKIKQPDDNHRTFISTVADLAAISFANAKRLDNAELTARIDPLTKLYNRRYFQERLLEEANLCTTNNSSLSIFLLDIDHFKSYNDQNGHQAGDQLLRSISELLKSKTRGSHIVARYGGEEFIILLTNTDKNQAWTFADHIRAAISSENFPHKEKQPLGCLSISGGVASFPSDGKTTEEVIKMADDALYQAKHMGRNKVIPTATIDLGSTT